MWSQVIVFLDFSQIMWVYLNIQGGKMREWGRKKMRHMVDLTELLELEHITMLPVN